MAISNLWEKTFWTSPVNYIPSTFIREYDMEKANISALYSIGLISKEEYDYFYRLDGQFRKVMVGHFLSNHMEDGYSKKLMYAIKDYRRQFFEANNIQDYEVLSIKNDAVYLINKIPKVCQFTETVHFRPKRTYTSFYKLDRKYNKELYYFLDTPNEIEYLHIDGMNDVAYRIHEPYMIDFLKVLFGTIETSNISDAIELLQVFSNSYLSKSIDINYYRRFDSISGFDSIATDHLGNMFNLRRLDIDKSIIDIGYNYGILMNLYRIVSNIALQSMK